MPIVNETTMTCPICGQPKPMTKTVCGRRACAEAYVKTTTLSLNQKRHDADAALLSLALVKPAPVGADAGEYRRQLRLAWDEAVAVVDALRARYWPRLDDVRAALKAHARTVPTLPPQERRAALINEERLLEDEHTMTLELIEAETTMREALSAYEDRLDFEQALRHDAALKDSTTPVLVACRHCGVPISFWESRDFCSETCRRAFVPYHGAWLPCCAVCHRYFKRTSPEIPDCDPVCSVACLRLSRNDPDDFPSPDHLYWNVQYTHRRPPMTPKARAKLLVKSANGHAPPPLVSETAAKILAVLADGPIAQSDLYRHFSNERRTRERMMDALAELRAERYVTCRMTGQGRPGRPAMIWALTHILSVP